MPTEHIHFVTGRLAEHALRGVLKDVAPRVGFQYSVDVLGISVAALMTPQWIAPRIKVPAEATRVMIPGYCGGELEVIERQAGVVVERGPKDLRELADYFGQSARAANNANERAYDIEILAEINFAPRLTRQELLTTAASLRESGADVIDVGCEPGDAWSGVGEAVRALRDAGHRVSIDSLNPAEIGPAVRAGAELVLSVNSTNRKAAADWGCEVVAIPDVPSTMAGLDDTIDWLTRHNVRFRIDPVLEPIAFGFAMSLGRYLDVRARYPQHEMLMGIGNLTELTDADSGPMNVLLLGFCQEVGIRSVLTTQVINWARTSVCECDLARRLVYRAVSGRMLPKHLETRLVMLRDPKLLSFGADELERLAAAIKDPNYRLFVEQGKLHLVSAGLHLEADDPYELFRQLEAVGPRNLDPAHAFYLGYELSKAATALTLGKNYRQDEALNWGFLTRPEKGRPNHAFDRRRSDAQNDDAAGGS